MWKTGQKKQAPFLASEANVQKFDQYLDALDQFDQGEMQALWRRHRHDIFKTGSYVAAYRLPHISARPRH